MLSRAGLLRAAGVAVVGAMIPEGVQAGPIPEHRGGFSTNETDGVALTAYAPKPGAIAAYARGRTALYAYGTETCVDCSGPGVHIHMRPLNRHLPKGAKGDLFVDYYGRLWFHRGPRGWKRLA